MRELMQAIVTVLREGRRAALATVTRTSGSTPQEPGARLLWIEGDEPVGTVGGGAIEAAVIEHLKTCLRDGKSGVHAFDLGRDLGMCCGGRMEVFVERLESQPRLLIFGAGHVSRPTAEMARRVGFRVVVVDDRTELNSEARFAGCERILSEPRDAATSLTPTDADWILVVTHDHRLDEEALDTFARLPHRYLGVIGSRRKIFRILQRIHARHGLPALDRVYAPVGLDIGAVTPEEIAVSIIAELVALRHGRESDHLRAVEHPALKEILGGELSVEAGAHLAQALEREDRN